MNYSILTACLNSERTIRRAIDSVLSQKIQPAEYVFVDGGSADGTLQMIWEKELFAKKNNFPEFKLQKKSNALVSEGIIGDEKIILVKPQTFMNESGKAVKSLTTHHKLPTTNCLLPCSIF